MAAQMTLGTQSDEKFVALWMLIMQHDDPAKAA